MANPIDAQNVGMFSAAAYTPIGQPIDTTATPLPPGWSDITLQFFGGGAAGAQFYSDSDPDNSNGNNEFRIYQNSSEKQIVIAFKGSDNVSNFISDVNLTDQGASAYLTVIKNRATVALETLQQIAAYDGYTYYTDGHSLGGGMAQSFALRTASMALGRTRCPSRRAQSTRTIQTLVLTRSHRLKKRSMPL